MKRVTSYAVLSPTQFTDPRLTRAETLDAAESSPSPGDGCWAGLTSRFASAVLSICTWDVLRGCSQPKPTQAPPKKRQSWYNVRQEPDSDRFVVHAAPEPDSSSETLAGASHEPRRPRCRSEQPLPDEGPSSEPAMCQICFAEPANAVMLPCRHGDICTSCVRRAMFMKPLHKGGGSCPLCRRRIKQVVCVTSDAIDTPSILPRQGMALTMWGRAC